MSGSRQPIKAMVAARLFPRAVFKQRMAKWGVVCKLEGAASLVEYVIPLDSRPRHSSGTKGRHGASSCCDLAHPQSHRIHIRILGVFSLCLICVSEGLRAVV